MKIKTTHDIAEAFRKNRADGCDKALKIISENYSVIFEITTDIVNAEKIIW